MSANVDLFVRVLAQIEKWRSRQSSTPLFNAANTLCDLYRISAQHCGLDEQVLRDKVAAEVADGAVQQ